MNKNENPDIHRKFYLNHIAEMQELSVRDFIFENMTDMTFFTYIKDFKLIDWSGFKPSMKNHLHLILHSIMPIGSVKGKPSSLIKSNTLITLPRDVLEIIYGKGVWKGKRINLENKDSNINCSFLFDEDIKITADDLMIDLLDLHIWMQTSPDFKGRSKEDVVEELGNREKASLENLIAEMYHMLIDPEVQISNKAQLITYIVNKYEGMKIHGLSKNTIDKHIKNSLATFEKSLSGDLDFSE